MTVKQTVSSIACLFLFITVKGQVTIGAGQQSVDINFNNIKRLTNATAFVGADKKGNINSSVVNDVALLKLTSPGNIPPSQFAGVFFNEIPNLKNGVTLWRYKPWNSWTKPVAVTQATKMADWDVQFFYWQYQDGLYGAAVPLSGNGFRTTLGANGNTWGSKAISYAENKDITEVPGVAVAFGRDPFELFARIYKTALTAMGKGDNLFSKKKLPEPLQYLGWCTWNSSDLGKNLNEEHIIEGVKTFTDHKYPLGWVLVDDGWFQHQNSQLRAILPDPKKFPNGFKPLINKLKNQYGVKYAGVWHAFNGYWNGIDPNSPLGDEYKGKLFSWQQRERVEDANSPLKTFSFLKPEGDNIEGFYNTMHKYLKGEGFDFVKVDNQLSVERMAPNNYPIDFLSGEMHRSLYKSVNKYFDGTIINCMDMTAEAYLNFGSSPVARAVEDYFPYEKGETYNLQRGNAAAHVLQAVYNSLYFSQMVFPDFDMFQSHNPNAVFHALARTLNNGPIYITDIPGKQNFDILNRIVYADGRSIRSQTALLPTEDCLFQVQQNKVFKAYTKVGNTGLMALYNAADADNVSGTFKAADVHGLNAAGKYALYEYFSGKLRISGLKQSYPVSIPRLGYQLQYIVPVKNGFAPFGLVNKYNAPATIVKQKWAGKKATITLYEGGTFKAYAATKPTAVLVNGKAQAFLYKGNLLTTNIEKTLQKPEIALEW